MSRRGAYRLSGVETTNLADLYGTPLLAWDRITTTTVDPGGATRVGASERSASEARRGATSLRAPGHLPRRAAVRRAMIAVTVALVCLALTSCHGPVSTHAVTIQTDCTLSFGGGPPVTTTATLHVSVDTRRSPRRAIRCRSST